MWYRLEGQWKMPIVYGKLGGGGSNASDVVWYAHCDKCQAVGPLAFRQSEARNDAAKEGWAFDAQGEFALCSSCLRLLKRSLNETEKIMAKLVGE